MKLDFTQMKKKIINKEVINIDVLTVKRIIKSNIKAIKCLLDNIENDLDNDQIDFLNVHNLLSFAEAIDYCFKLYVYKNRKNLKKVKDVSKISNIENI